MKTHLAAGAANCSTGTWQQKWNCGWHEGTSPAVSQAGYNFGHVLPVLLVILVILLAVRALRKRTKSASPAGARR